MERHGFLSRQGLRIFFLWSSKLNIIISFLSWHDMTKLNITVVLFIIMHDAVCISDPSSMQMYVCTAHINRKKCNWAGSKSPQSSSVSQDHPTDVWKVIAMLVSGIKSLSFEVLYARGKLNTVRLLLWHNSALNYPVYSRPPPQRKKWRRSVCDSALIINHYSAKARMISLNS